MAETLTYDAGTDTVTTEENLNADEQDSLQVGEAMVEQQEQLLAGKYKNAQELESAYVELQKKLGDKGSETSEEAGDTESSKQETEEKETNKAEKDSKETNVLDELWEEAQSGKKFSNEILSKLQEANPQELAKMHLEYRQEVSQRQPEKQDFSEQQVQSLKNVAGGEKEYDNMLRWANQNLNEQEVKMFDQVMEQGNPLAAFFAVRALSYRYNDARGYEGKMLTGNAPKQSGDQFRSQAEVVQAMSDPRYDKDSAYRQDVMKKLERSNVNF